MKRYSKVTLIIGWDDKKTEDPSKWDYPKLFQMMSDEDIVLVSAQEVERPNKKEKPKMVIQVKLFKKGIVIKHPQKGALKVKDITEGPKGLLRVTFTDEVKNEHIIFLRPEQEFQRIE